MAMTNAEYFRRQAATLPALAKFCRDLEVARGLFGMAQEFKAKAAEVDADLQPMPSPALGRRLRLDDPPDSTTAGLRPQPGLASLGLPALAPSLELPALGRNSGWLQAVRRHAGDRAADSRSLTIPTESANARCRLAFFGADYRFGAGLSLRWASCNIPTIS